ncbi:MAG: trypsin-like peptidase domain-containing protein [Caulobacterales bacterium]|nr:trypsin-like peptidase domain-containing protein [Caulobacterales bacterium]
MRGFDLIAYAVLIAGIVYLIVIHEDDAPAPQTAEELSVSPPPGDLEADVLLNLPIDAEPGSGTAFSIDEGVWFTARHVVDGCASVGVIVSGQQGVLAQDISLAPNTDLAILHAPLKRAPFPLELDGSDLPVGARSYHIGYPQGLPGETATRLLGREHIAISGRFDAYAPILAWAETGRTAGLDGPLGGLSGGPAIGEDGDVVGVVIAEAPRRGRIYTAAPSSIALALQETQTEPARRAPSTGALTVENYAETARRLRRDLRVAKIICVVA